MSSLPFITSWTSIVISSIIADKLITSQKFSKLNIRKVFNGMGFLLSAATIVGASFVTSSHVYTGVALFSLATTFS
jgi:hypothetical protein